SARLIHQLPFEFAHGANRFDVVGSADERGDSSFSPRAKLILNSLARTTEGGLVDQFVGHSGDGFVLFPGEVEVLNGLCRFFVAVAARQLVIKILSARAHPADVERQVRLHLHATLIDIIADYNAYGGSDVEICERFSVGPSREAFIERFAKDVYTL